MGDLPDQARLTHAGLADEPNDLAVAGLGALVVLGVYELTGSRTLGGISGGAFLVLADAGLIYLVGSAFAHFDVSRATPE